jgi:hypothetical protein
MPRYRLRTLLILLAVGPPLLAGLWMAYQIYQRPAPPPDPFSFYFGARF